MKTRADTADHTTVDLAIEANPLALGGALAKDSAAFFSQAL